MLQKVFSFLNFLQTWESSRPRKLPRRNFLSLSALDLLLTIIGGRARQTAKTFFSNCTTHEQDFSFRCVVICSYLFFYLLFISKRFCVLPSCAKMLWVNETSEWQGFLKLFSGRASEMIFTFIIFLHGVITLLTKIFCFLRCVSHNINTREEKQKKKKQSEQHQLLS